jgi:5'(3')-deoxyribonucleotidase
MDINSHDGPSQPLDALDLQHLKQSVKEESASILDMDFEKQRQRNLTVQEAGKRDIRQ